MKPDTTEAVRGSRSCSKTEVAGLKTFMLENRSRRGLNQDSLVGAVLFSFPYRPASWPSASTCGIGHCLGETTTAELLSFSSSL